MLYPWIVTNKMGILLLFPLGEHFVVQLLRRDQVGSLMWTYGRNTTQPYKEHADNYIFEKTNMYGKRSVAVKH